MKDPNERDTKHESTSQMMYSMSAPNTRSDDFTFGVTVTVTFGGETHAGCIVYVGIRFSHDVAVRAAKRVAMFFTRSVATEENGLDPHGIIDFESIEVTGVAERLDGDTTRLIDPSEYDRRWSPSKTPS